MYPIRRFGGIKMNVFDGGQIRDGRAQVYDTQYIDTAG